SLASIVHSDPSILEPHLSQFENGSSNGFCALNTALWEDGAFVRVSKRSVVERPIVVQFISSGMSDDRPIVSHPRVLILAEEASDVTVLECFSGDGHASYLTNSITE